MIDFSDGEWVEVKDPQLDDVWDKYYWRHTYIYENGVMRKEPIWEKFVPTPHVPTEPGVYRDNEGDAWLFGKNGRAYTYNKGYVAFDGDGDTEPEEYLPFTFIAPLHIDVEEDKE